MGMAGFGVGGKEIKLEGAAAREHQSMMRMMKDMNAQQAAAAAAANGGKGDKDMLMAGNYGHISQNSERKFFDTVKEMLSSVSREAWAEFVRCLELFSCDAVTKKDMFALVQDLFGAAHQELFEEFKLLMATRANYDAQPSDMWYARTYTHTHTAAPDP